MLYEHQASADEISDTIFQLIPTNEFRQFETSERVPVSPWVFYSLLNACERKEADMAAKLYRELSGSPSAAMFRNFLFERLLLRSLDDIESDADLKIRGLTDPIKRTGYIMVPFHAPPLMDRNASQRSTKRLRTISVCIWYLYLPTLEPFIRSSTTRRILSSPVSKLQ